MPKRNVWSFCFFGGPTCTTFVLIPGGCPTWRPSAPCYHALQKWRGAKVEESLFCLFMLSFGQFQVFLIIFECFRALCCYKSKCNEQNPNRRTGAIDQVVFFADRCLAASTPVHRAASGQLRLPLTGLKLKDLKASFLVLVGLRGMSCLIHLSRIVNRCKQMISNIPSCLRLVQIQILILANWIQSHRWFCSHEASEIPESPSLSDLSWQKVSSVTSVALTCSGSQSMRKSTKAVKGTSKSGALGRAIKILDVG